MVNHDGTEHTRIFRGVAEVGEVLKRMDGIVGTSVEPQVAVMFDVDNRWALEAAQGPRREHKDYEETALAHYRPFWDMGVPIDVIAHDHDLSQYKLLIAPMLYMVRQETADRIADFVRQGGTLVLTYWSGTSSTSTTAVIWPFGPDRWPMLWTSVMRTQMLFTKARPTP